MKTNFITLGSCSSLAVALALLAALPAHAETKPAKAKQPAAEAKAEVIEVPRSEFAIPAKAGEGRDPFFPLSRRMIVEARPATTNSAPKPVSVSLVLKGISNNGSKRFALINDKTFESGEEREVPFGDSKMRVLCVEIREDSVLVEVGGSRQELRLKPGI